jgi:hypothetical protein
MAALTGFYFFVSTNNATATRITTVRSITVDDDAVPIVVAMGR